MEVDLHSVALVAGGLLEVDAVREHLLLDLVHQDPRAHLAPMSSRPQFGKHNPRVVQAERLTGQMHVRREVIREVLLYVRSMGPDPAEDLDEKPRG